jgi:hypothetical protein
MSSRFYFHLVKGQQRIPDRFGVELSYEAVISSRALEVARDIWPGTMDDQVAWQGWSIEIVDSAGQVVRVIALS